MCLLLLGLVESAAKPALRIGFTIPLFVLIGTGFFIYRRCDQLFGRDPEVANDSPVARHNRLEAVAIIWGGLTLVVLSVLYQLWFG